MNTCFVMQPFDKGVFDQRYEDVIKPAIEGAGLEAYRVDQDPTVSIPIKDIEKGIRDSAICLCEITEDNPNVWFELGFAIACRKEVVLICSAERTSKFPFDVQHRTIIPYKTGSPRDFKKLQSDITEKVRAYFDKSEKLTNVVNVSKVIPFEGLEQHEIVCIATIGESSLVQSLFEIQRDMEQTGFTNMATAIAIKGLLKKGYIEEGKFMDDSNNYESFTGYTLSEMGWNWVLENQDKFVLQKPAPEPRQTDTR